MIVAESELPIEGAEVSSGKHTVDGNLQVMYRYKAEDIDMED